MLVKSFNLLILKQECKCGSQKCRGYVGPTKQNMLKKKSLKEKYEELKRFNLYYYRNKTLNNVIKGLTKGDKNYYFLFLVQKY